MQLARRVRGRRRTGGSSANATDGIVMTMSAKGGSEELEMGKNRTRPTKADTHEDMEGSCVSDACQDEESGVIRSGPAIGGGAAARERRNPINPPDAINLNLEADDPHHPIQTFDN